MHYVLTIRCRGDSRIARNFKILSKIIGAFGRPRPTNFSVAVGIVQFCNVSRRHQGTALRCTNLFFIKFKRAVVGARPYGCRMFLRFRYPKPPLPKGRGTTKWWRDTYMRRRHRNVTEGNTSCAKRASCRKALNRTKSCFISTKVTDH